MKKNTAKEKGENNSSPFPYLAIVII